MAFPFSHQRLPNLSEDSFSSLEKKISSLTTERSRRENEMLYMKETLLSLWNALQMSSDDLDRSILTRLMEGPARLHTKTFDKAREEIHRQETAKARILKDLIGKKIEEIQSVCDTGHLPLPQDVQDIKHCEESGDVPSAGHLANALARLTRTLTQLTTLAERRSAILTMIRELESARSEIDWLTSYERDGDRYRGRDSNRKLQRAIKAGKLRDRLPSMIEKLDSVIMEWERTEHQPFVFDGVDYRRQVLETYELQAPPPSSRSTKNGKKTQQSGRQTPSGRKSAMPDMTPCRSGRDSTRGRLTPGSNSKSICLGEGRSRIARPQTSLGSAIRENKCSHLFKNAQTDYHPLQERLDQLLGNGQMATSSSSSSSSSRAGHDTLVKSGIPRTPTKPVSQEIAVSKEASGADSNGNTTSGDEDMEDVMPIIHEPYRSLPPPALNLDALKRNVSVVGQSSSVAASSKRRPTF